MLKHRGFTLLEMLIGFAMCAVLATIAFSSYKSMKEKADFKSMHEVASRLALAQQRHRLSFSTYASTVTATGTDSQTNLVFDSTSIDGVPKYQIEVTSANFTEFVASIAPLNQPDSSSVLNHCYRIVVSSRQGFLAYSATNANGETVNDCLPRV